MNLKRWIKSFGDTHLVRAENRYSGNVTVSICKGDMKQQILNVHNSGTPALCEYIRDCLRGDYKIVDRPGYLIPMQGKSADYKEMFSYGIPYSASTIDASTSDSASYTLTFILPSTILYGKNEITGLHLYNVGTGKTLYAEVDLRDTPIQFPQGVNIEIKWNLKVSIR